MDAVFDPIFHVIRVSNVRPILGEFHLNCRIAANSKLDARVLTFHCLAMIPFYKITYIL